MTIKPTLATLSIDTHTQSMTPTQPCNIDPIHRCQMILKVLTVENDVTPFSNAVGSSSNLAFEWLIEEDELYICPDDRNVSLHQWW